MRVDSFPELGPTEQVAVRLALARVYELVDRPRGRDENAWRRAALFEAAGHEMDDQALSPRRTRGATRA